MSEEGPKIELPKKGAGDTAPFQVFNMETLEKSKTGTENAGKRPNVLQRVGATLKGFGVRVHDETIGPDLGKAIEKIKAEGENSTILNPTGLKVGKEITKAADKLGSF